MELNNRSYELAGKIISLLRGEHMDDQKTALILAVSDVAREDKRQKEKDSGEEANVR
jgi:hypothetical protein